MIEVQSIEQRNRQPEEPGDMKNKREQRQYKTNKYEQHTDILLPERIFGVSYLTFLFPQTQVFVWEKFKF